MVIYFVDSNCPSIGSIIASSVTMVPTTELPTNSADLYLTVGIPVVVCVMVIISAVTTLFIACFARKKFKRKDQGLLDTSKCYFFYFIFIVFFVSDVSDIKPDDNPCYITASNIHAKDNPYYSTVSNPKFSMNKETVYEVVDPVGAS